MKNKIHSLIIEGILFCGSGLALLLYSLVSYSKAFNKSWAQSPYLFPLFTALALIGISLWLIAEGVSEMRKETDGPVPEKKLTREQTGWVLAALLLCVCYYLALDLLKIPYISIGILSFVYTFSTFEVVTIFFLVAMMAFMGVRKPLILVFVPLGTTLFLSIAFRTLLHVLLP